MQCAKGRQGNIEFDGKDYTEFTAADVGGGYCKKPYTDVYLTKDACQAAQRNWAENQPTIDLCAQACVNRGAENSDCYAFNWVQSGYKCYLYDSTVLDATLIPYSCNKYTSSITGLPVYSGWPFFKLKRKPVGMAQIAERIPT